jgi:hypothetical protein
MQKGSATLAVFLFPMTAVAAHWGATFSPEAVATHVHGSDLKILVAAAGEELEETQTAADALAIALRDCGKTALVIGTAGLGRVDHLDDETIVAKSAARPVDQVFVVRLFPSGAGKPPSAVVSMYDKSGANVGAFTAVGGVALARKKSASGSPLAETDSAADPEQANQAVASSGDTGSAKNTEPESHEPGGVGGGIRADVAEMVSKVTDGLDNTSAKEEYETRAILFQDLAVVSVNTGAVRTWAMPLKGKYKEPLEGIDFYEYLGRQDLAAQYRSRNMGRWGLVIGGGAVAIAGTYWAATGIGNRTDECKYYSSLDNSCLIYKRDTTQATAGAVVAGVGYVAALVGYFLFNPHPVDAPEARRLADEFNEALRAELGLSEEDVARAVIPSEPEVEVAIAPAIGPSGGALALTVAF